MALIWMVLGLLGGVSLVVQASLNAGLRERLQSISWAGLVSYLGGTIAMTIVVALVRSPLSVQQIRSTPAVWWIGGFFGAIYLAAAIILVPRIGTATLFALVVAGQLLCSVICDHFGWLGVPIHPLDFRRVAGAVLLLLGVFLIRL